MSTTETDAKDEATAVAEAAAADADATGDADATADATSGATQRAREVVADAADAARTAVEHAAPVVREAADVARTAVQTHGPAVIEAGRTTAGTAYEQVRRAPDEQLALGTAFAAGLAAGFLLARVPRPLLVLALIPLAVFGGTLLGRRVPFVKRAMGGGDD